MSGCIPDLFDQHTSGPRPGAVSAAPAKGDPASPAPDVLANVLASPAGGRRDGAGGPCPHCEAMGYTYSETFKHECLVRDLASRPREERKAVYRGWARRYGEAAARELMREVLVEWQKGYA